MHLNLRPAFSVETVCCSKKLCVIEIKCLSGDGRFQFLMKLLSVV